MMEFLFVLFANFIFCILMQTNLKL